MPQILVRYGELALKSPNVRRRFEDRLVRNIHELFLSEKLECLTRMERGRIFLTVADFGRASSALSRVFGVVSFSPVHETTHEIAEVEKMVVELAEPLIEEGSSFAIRATRAGSQGYTSQDLAKAVGATVMAQFKDRKISVDLDEPDVELFVEARDNRAFSFTESFKGPGGMPYGTQGRALTVIEREEDVAAAWLVAKRGCEIVCAEKSNGLSEPLKKWCPRLEVIPLPQASEALWDIAYNNGAQAIILGWDVSRIEGGALKGSLPVFYPLVGLSGDETIALVKKISR
jgi:thiamine biosynthesis protein ThiI